METEDGEVLREDLSLKPVEVTTSARPEESGTVARLTAALRVREMEADEVDEVDRRMRSCRIWSLVFNAS